MEKCIPRSEDWAWDQPGREQITSFKMPPCRNWISLWLCLLFETLHTTLGCSSWCSPKLCVWPEANGHLGREQTSLGSSLMVLKEILLPDQAQCFPQCFHEIFLPLTKVFACLFLSRGSGEAGEVLEKGRDFWLLAGLQTRRFLTFQFYLWKVCCHIM